MPLRFAVVAGFCFLTLPTLPAEAAPPRASVDRAVRAAVAAGTPSQKVIITVNPGCRAAVRAGLTAHGDRLDDDLPLVDAVAGDVHSGDIASLAANGCVKAIAADADVSASASAAKSADVRAG